MVFTVNQDSTIGISLLSATKTLQVQLDPQLLTNSQSISSLEQIKEMLQWSFNKLEITSIFFMPKWPNNGPASLGFMGPSMNKLTTLTAKELQKYRELIFDINMLMLRVSQTIVVDVGSGIDNLMIDLFSKADVLIGNRGGRFHFNHLLLGLPLMTIHLNQRGRFAHQGMIDSALMNSSSIDHLQLKEQFILSQIYDESDRDLCLKKILTQFCHQQPITRIQGKLAINHHQLIDFEEAFKSDQKIFLACLQAQEWMQQLPNDFAGYLKQFKESISKDFLSQEEEKTRNKNNILPFRQKNNLSDSLPS